MNVKQPAQPIDFRTPPPAIAATARAWQAWWEDHDMWDGFVAYADLDTAKVHAAVDYVGEEHGWVPGDDPADEAPDITLTWEFGHERWRLLTDGKDTGVQLYETKTYALRDMPQGFRHVHAVAVRCAVCSYELDEEESYTVFFDSVKQATEGARDVGWTVLADGRVLCSGDDQEHGDLYRTVGVRETS